MAIQPFINKPIGGINQNANPNEFPPTDFLDGYDVIDRNPREKNEKTLLQPSNNTVFAYDLGEAELTKKKYRVSMDLTGLADCIVRLNFKILGITDTFVAANYTSGQSAATLLAALDAATTVYTFTEITASGFILVFDIEYSASNYTDFFLTVTDSLGGTYLAQTRLDAVSSEKVGAFRPICFSNINNDEQVFATTNILEPISILVESPPAALGMFVTFSENPNIGVNEEVYIYPAAQSANQFSALCFLTPFSGSDVTYIVTGTNALAIGATGVYYVVRNYRSLSAIGYAQKNEVSKTWNYTELVRSNKLNFRSYKQIEGRLDVTSDGIIYNFTDFLNQIKRLIYVNGSVGITYGGFLIPYNSDAYYDLDTIGNESQLQLGVNTSKVTLSIPTFAGGAGIVGSKNESCYVVFVRFKTADGAYTTYSKASNVLWLHSSDIYDHSSTSNSGLSLQIFIEQINEGYFESLQVGIIEFTTSSWKGYSLPEINITGDSMTILDSGFNNESYLAFNDANVLLEQIPFVFENARSLLGYNNYMIAANVNLYREYDLTAWAQTIDLKAKYRTIQIGSYAFYGLPENTASTILRGINDYSKCSNEWMSYMPYDHYRFCVYIDWINGSPTSTYWINDLSFDPADTLLSVGDAVTVGTPGDVFSVLQYYLEAKKINLEYILPDGKYLKDVVKDIRFGRALCNQQVQTTGFGMSVYENGSGDDYVSGFADGGFDVVDTKLALYSADFQNTQRTFNWRDGDLLKTKLIANEAATVFDTSNQGVSFIADNLGTSIEVEVTELANVENQSDNNIALYKYANSGEINIRNSAAVTLGSPLDTSLAYFRAQLFYYLTPYSSEGAYPEPPTQTRFFVIPQNQWYDKETHDSSTVYEIYGGDAFPTLSAYKVAENVDDELVNNAMFSYWHFNRTNAALRSGSFPYVTLRNYLAAKFLTETRFAEFPNDLYTYDAAFTPRYIFQNSSAFNPLLPQITNKFSSIYYSGVGFGSDLAGGNRIWLPLDTKQLESKYGAIVHMEVLFGLSGQNILMVWQERRFTAQYFDNTANIISNSGQLLIGSGKILERTGQDLTEFGCEYKWLIKKGKSKTGKDLAFWFDFRKGAIMRFGADGTSNIIGNISQLINNDTYLAILNQYANNDAPAQFFGCHATWDNINMEYIVTIRLAAKEVADREFGERFQKGEIKYSTTEFWGFEQFPVIYKSLIDDNTSTPPNSTWESIEGYDSDYFEILTLVWNEEDNKFKTSRTFTPKIYGQWNNTILSSHPVNNNLIYEHNAPLNEALYYEVETTTAVTATTDPILFRITGTGIESTFPSPFVVPDRAKYIVKIDGKNYEVVGTGTNYLQMANINEDTDDILPQATIENFLFLLQ